MDQKPYCRFCILEKNELIGVHSEIGRSYCMEDIIKQHFGILINSTDKISTKVCTVCWNKVDSFHGFYNQVLAAQMLLNDNNLSILEEDNTEEVRSSIGYENSANILDGKLKRECNKEESVVDLTGTTSSEDDLQEITSLDEEVKREHKDNEHESDLESNYSSDMIWVSEYEKTKTLRKSPRSILKTNTTHTERKKGIAMKRKKINTFDDNWKNKEIISDLEVHSKNKLHKPVSSSNSEDSKTEETGSLQGESVSESESQTERKAYNRKIIEGFYKLQCDICFVPFAKFDLMIQHYRTQHEKSGYIKCCNKTFYKKCELVEHANWHVNPDHFKCTVCNDGKIFNLNVTLTNHMRVHHAPRIFLQCDHCSKTFYSQSKLNVHVSNVHENTQDDVACDQCTFRCKSETYYRDHLKYVHENHAKRFVCEFCAEEFKFYSVFQEHLLRYHSNFDIGLSKKSECQICGKWVISMRNHMRNHKPIFTSGCSFAIY